MNTETVINWAYALHLDICANFIDLLDEKV